MTALIESARSFIGVPFRHQGRSDRGLDCAGLIVCSLKKIGISAHEITGYERRPFKGLLQKTVEQNPFLERCPIDMADILLMRFRHEPQHLAVFTGETIIHAYETIGRVIEERYSDFWRCRTVCAYRVIYE